MAYKRIIDRLLIEDWLPIIILEDYSIRVEYMKGRSVSYEVFTKEKEWIPITKENKELIEQVYTIDWKIELSSCKSKLRKISLLEDYYL